MFAIFGTQYPGTATFKTHAPLPHLTLVLSLHYREYISN